MIHVVAGALTDAEGRVLIAQRPPGKQLAGSWEFPGGKVQAGESRIEALARELREELGIVMGQPRPLMRLRHTYPFGEVLIDMWVVSRYSGEPRGLDGQALRWCTSAELDEAELLPADLPLVRALRLPERLVPAAVVLEGARVDGLRGRWCASLDDAGAADADFVVLTRPVPDEQLSAFCSSVPIPVYARLNDLAQAWVLGATGVNETDHG